MKKVGLFFELTKNCLIKVNGTETISASGHHEVSFRHWYLVTLDWCSATLNIICIVKLMR